MNKKWLSCFIFVAGMATTATALADNFDKRHSKEERTPDLYVWCEMMDVKLGFINTRTDQMFQVPLETLGRWPGSSCQHAWPTADGKIVYLTIDATEDVPAMVVVVRVRKIDWENSHADIQIIRKLELEPAGNPSDFPEVTEVDPDYPIAGWLTPPFTQGHGPSFLPHSPYTYLTQWPDSKIRVINTRTHRLAKSVDPIDFGDISRQTHGVNFNPSGTYGLGAGYYYDDDSIDVYRPNKETGELSYEGSIRLEDEDEEGHAAFTHYTVWLNNRYALTASMQFGPTSLTPEGEMIIPPSVWLLDVWERTAQKLVDTYSLDDPDTPGVFRSPSDLAVANFKLYLAEEDSLAGGEVFGRDGYISVFDIKDIEHPVFIKRFKPGEELPADYAVAHGLNVTLDERYIYAASYVSGYIVKIDTLTDEVVKVYGHEDGVHMPHGAFIAGNKR